MLKNTLLLCLLMLTTGIFGQAPAKKIHIYLLVGQSNMAGRGTPERIDTLTDPQILMFSKDEKWLPAKEPLAFDKPGVAGVGPGLAFGKAILASDKTATVGLVPAAVGGTAIDLWKPGAFDAATNTHPYDDAIRRAKNAMQLGELKGIIWHQGESDANMILSGEYESKLVQLIERFRRDLGYPDVPFILGEIGDFRPGQNLEIPKINAIIRKVAANTKNSGLAQCYGLTHKGDFIHFDTPSARELGKRYAAALLTVQK